MRERRRAYGGVSGQELHSVRLRLTQVDHRPGRQRPLSVQNVPMDPPRNRQQRRTDTLAKLGAEADVWVATANADGSPYLVPLSLFWDGKHVVVSAQRESRTIQNLLRSRAARLGLGPTRDVVLIDALVDGSWPAAEVPADMAEAFAARAGWDPREEDGDYVYVALEPSRIQAWREANELAGRTLLRGGNWLD